MHYLRLRMHLHTSKVANRLAPDTSFKSLSLPHPLPISGPLKGVRNRREFLTLFGRRDLRCVQAHEYINISTS